MASTHLIDAIVRQTTVLIAALATAQGQRAPLSGLANQVFLDLVKELKSQGLGNKVIADMFGLALRTYHNQVARHSESRSQAGRSIWEAVLAFVEGQGTVLRAEVHARFGRDDPAVVRGVLKDLVDSGLVFRTGSGDRTAYRLARPDEVAGSEPDREAVLASLVLVAIYQHGPLGADAVARLVPMERAALDALLSSLVEAGRAQVEGPPDKARYRCDQLVIDFGDAAGWEAALFDHYQAMFNAICAKLQGGGAIAAQDDAIGGSTYALDVWDGHPLQAEALGTLARLRRQCSELRERIEHHNQSHPAPPGAIARRVVTYVGQTVREDGGQDDA